MPYGCYLLKKNAAPNRSSIFALGILISLLKEIVSQCNAIGSWVA